MKKLRPLLIGFNLLGIAMSSQAADLLQVYQQAKSSNPTLLESAADRDAAFEKINQVRSDLLPQLGLQANYNYNNGYRDQRDINSNALGGNLTLSQSIFNLTNWRSLTIQEQTAGIADVQYQAQQQQLILDTATAYFKVLQAIDSLSYTEAQKKAVYRQLDQTTQRFNVGLVAITDVQNARASYDSVLADEVTAKNNLDNALENLRQVTGISYNQLAALNITDFRMKQPEGVNNLLKQAEQHNLSLLAARLNTEMAKQQIKLAQTGHMPTLGLTASTSLNNINNNGQRNLSPNSYTGNNTVGLNFSLPLYQGGSINSQVKQAQLGYASQSQALESQHRNMVQTVRSSYNNINASISGVNAYKQAVVSAESSLKSMEAGYQVGTRTIVDVLNATTTLYNAKQQLSQARYSYLINQLNIKAALGTLNEQDVQTINQTLGKEISTEDSQVTADTAQ